MGRCVGSIRVDEPEFGERKNVYPVYPRQSCYVSSEIFNGLLWGTNVFLSPNLYVCRILEQSKIIIIGMLVLGHLLVPLLIHLHHSLICLL